MKRFFTILAAFAIVSTSFAQVPRKVLLEHFTSASCGPCAAINPQVETLLGNNAPDVLSIKYQVNWPTPGGDPMNLHNQFDVNGRVGYYGVSSVPGSVLAGDGPEHPSSKMTQQNLDIEKAKTSPFTMNLTHELSESFDQINVKLDISAVENYSGTGNLVAHVVVIEKHISFDAPAGSNGETDFFNVMKKMMPTSNGTNLKKDWASGDDRTINLSWTLKNVYNLDQLDVVAFIQDMGNKEIMQAVDGEPIVKNNIDGLVVDANPPSDFNSPGTICGEEITPEVIILNGGSETLTSLDITFNVNGGANQTVNWTGSLEYLQTESLTLPTVPFSAQFFNELNITTSNPNGEADQNADNDEYQHLFPSAASTTVNSVVQVTPLGSPQNLSWKIFNSNNEEVASGGPYSVPNQPVSENVTLDANDCYHLDANNRINAFNGRIALINDQGETTGFTNVSSFGITSMIFGTYSVNSSVDKILNSQSIAIYPNPASQSVTVDFEMVENSGVDFVVLNTIGQQVLNLSKDFTIGTQQEKINISSLSNGLYFLQLKTEQGMITNRLLIEK